MRKRTSLLILMVPLLVMAFGFREPATAMEPLWATSPLHEYAEVSWSSDDAQSFDVHYEETAPSQWIGSYHPAYPLTDGWRFRDIDAPKGSLITFASLSLVKKMDQTGSLRFTFFGERTTNAPTFDYFNTPADRATTYASVPFTDSKKYYGNLRYTFFGLEPIIQEIVDQEAWDAGNSLVLLAKSGPDCCSAMMWYTFDHSPFVSGAILNIEYKPPPPTVPRIWLPLVCKHD